MASDDHASPSTGGEFLLQLLQNRHSNSSITTNSGSTSNSSSTDFSVDLSDHPHLDPAVKVIGPSLTIQRPNPSLLDPYAQNHQFTRNNISSSPPLLPRRLGTNPWPMYGIPVTDSTDSRNSQFPKNRPLVGVDFQKLEFLQGALSSDGLSNVQEGNQNPREQGGFSVRYPLKFGSFNEEVLSGVSLESRSKSKEHDVSREGRGIRTGMNSYEGLRRGGNVQESKSFMPTGRLEVQAQETCTKEVSNLIGRRNDMCNHAPKLPVDIRMDCTALSKGNDPNSVYLFRESIRNLNGDEVQENLESEIQGIAKAIERNLELTREDDNNRDEMDERIAEILMNAVETDKVNDTGICNSSRSQDSRFNSSRVIQACSNRMWNRKRETQCRGDIQRLNSSFLKIYESLIPLVDEKEKQNQLLASLRKLISKEWPNAQLHVYGSCANSFGVSNSDIDICLAIDNTNEKKSDILLKLAEILLSDNLQNVQALTRARVPVVKFKDPVTGISCDICINNILAVVNTKLLRDYSQIDPRLCQLAFIVKHWAKSRGVNETYKGTLSSYAYVLMCIHFLQLRRPAILPCLQEMEATYVVTVGDIKCAYFDDIARLRNYGAENHECVAKLLWAFFDYWAYRHDYANSVISVRTGHFVSKRSKDWTRRIGNDRHLICIEDPFDISHDLGRVVDKYSIKILREEFVRAAEIMQSYPNPAALLFEPYKSSDTDL